jgi:hypothetical protein
MTALKFLLPFGLWLFLFYPIVLGQSTIVGDTSGFYALLKFFVDNLAQGAFTLWNPFLFSGFPFLLESLFFGVFNPTWLILLLLSKLGISFYLSFIWTYVGYFFVGQIGFYLLAKSVLKNALAAYVAFLILFFSFFGMYIFSNPTSVLVSVPMAWFFYFFVQWWQTRKKKFFVGIVFALMIIANCYLPFYWLTVFILVCIFYCVFYRTRLKSDLFAIASFTRHHSWLVVLCFLAFGLTLIVSLKGYQVVRQGEVLALDRKISEQDINKGGVEVAYGKAANLCVTAQATAKGLFFNLDKISASFGVRYFSLFVYCILLLGLFNRIKKKAAFLFLLTLIFFFIVLGNQTPVYRFFYNYFSCFKFIHALGTFYFVLAPIFILFAAFQLRSILTDKLMIHRHLRLGAVLAVHAGIWFFLKSQPMLFSTYATILLSTILFSFIVLEYRLPQFLGAMLLVLCVLMQPIEVMWRFHDDLENMDFNKDRILQNCTYPSASPSFSFIRPDDKENFDGYDVHKSYIQMKDAAGFPLAGAGYPPKWPYYLLQHFGQSARQYAKHKFYLYDHICIIKNEDQAESLMEKILVNSENLAVISLLPGSQFQERLEKTSLMQNDSEKAGRALVIVEASKNFEVLSFSVNSIKLKTHFEKEKFLVYTDSFHSDWKATINGHKIDVYRANIAFKGVVVPAGENVIVLRYAPLGGQLFYFFVLIVHIGLLCYLVFLFLRSPRRREGPDVENN